MGIYLNPNNIDFYGAVNHSQIYVDKTELIKYTNSVLSGQQRFLCVSRPRRFGKSMAADMLTAYYSRGCDSKELFSKYKISDSDTFDKHLNKYNVIRINALEFMADTKNVCEMISEIQKSVLFDLTEEFSDVRYYDSTKLIRSLKDVFGKHQIPFVIIIDEWDCVLRDKTNNESDKKQYLDFLCALFKGQSYTALAYMTGILPIKKYGEHSALNMFDEYSITNSEPISSCAGFTENEVMNLCEKYNMSFEEMKEWYNGYNVDGTSIYNPRSVVSSLLRGGFNNYWTSTETYEALKVYIEMNFDGLRDTIIDLLAGQKSKVDTTTFVNDMVNLATKDDVLTLLIHLGYLTYDFRTREVSIPNYEIEEQFASTIKVMGWSEVAMSLERSDELLKATLNCEEEKVAELIEQAHQDNTSNLQYNNENSLACVVSIAYYSARRSYEMYRELPAGKGFADIVFMPRKNNPNPAVIAELKWDLTAESAIEQIKHKKYTDCLKDYTGEVLLVGISYEKEKGENHKHHICRIEKIVK